MNASVKKKDGKQILESSLASVSTMLTRKINAVKVNHSRNFLQPCTELDIDLQTILLFLLRSFNCVLLILSKLAALADQ